MSLRAKVARLSASQPHTSWQVWRQANGGADAFTCRDYPHETLTRADLDARPGPPGCCRIIVLREGGTP